MGEQNAGQPLYVALVSAEFAWDYPLSADDIAERLDGVKAWRDQYARDAAIEITHDPARPGKMIVQVQVDRSVHEHRPNVRPTAPTVTRDGGDPR